jgi:UDP-glucose 4-epimerase
MDSPASGLTGRRVLVTGGLGFLGLNLVSPLLDAGAGVRILNRSLNPLACRWLEAVRAGRSVERVEGDIGDPGCLASVLQGVDVVIDLAGESGAVRSLREARMDMEVNVAGHLTLLDTLRRLARPPRLVFASSRLVYGVTGAAAVGEDHPTRPTSLYGLHKLTVEHYLRIYREQFGVPFTVLRLTNPYGPFQLPERRHYGVLNQFVIAAIRDQALPLYGGGGQLRDYVHAADVARAILSACASEQAEGATFNVGAGSSVSFADAARTVVGLAGSGRVAIEPWPEGYRRVETGDFVCDISRIRAQLGWSPKVLLNEGLQTTIASYRSLLDGATADPHAT